MPNINGTFHRRNSGLLVIGGKGSKQAGNEKKDNCSRDIMLECLQKGSVAGQGVMDQG